MSKRNDLHELINRANKVHNNKYEYSLITNYNSMNEYQDIICPKHGIFRIPLHWHINKGRGCKRCAIDDVTYSREQFINNAKRVHEDKYNYDKVVYINGRKKVIITCPIHGDFMQRPRDHVNAKQGCPICKKSKNEKFIYNILQLHNIDFIPQHSFFDLRYRRQLFFDFYLPKLNCCIEYDGEQHFRVIPGMTNDKVFRDIQIRDRLKNDYCKNNKILFLRLSYKDKDFDIKSKILSFLEINESIVKISDF